MSQNSKGHFITFEGPEGCGKTEQIKRLALRLGAESKHVLTLREPGGTEIGEKLRQILKDPKNTEMFPLTELLLFAASRHQLVQEVIKPALERGAFVLCDRFLDSTVVYQHFARGLPRHLIDELNNIAIAGCEPDTTIVLKITPAESRRRLQRRSADVGSTSACKFDEESDDFFAKVLEGYNSLIGSRYFHINGARSMVEVETDIWDHLQTTH